MFLQVWYLLSIVWNIQQTIDYKMYKIVASVRMHLYRKLFLFFNRLFRSSNWNTMLKLAFSGWWKTKTIITGLSYRYQLFVDFLVERKLMTSRHRSNGTRAQAINESWEIQLKNKDFFPGNKGLLLYYGILSGGVPVSFSFQQFDDFPGEDAPGAVTRVRNGIFAETLLKATVVPAEQWPFLLFFKTTRKICRFVVCWEVDVLLKLCVGDITNFLFVNYKN